MKTKEQILEQSYMTANDLKQLIPTMGINRCIDCIKEIQDEMEAKGYYVPKTRPFVALTKLVRKKLGI